MTDHKYRGTGTGWYRWTDENGKERYSRKCAFCDLPKSEHGKAAAK